MAIIPLIFNHRQLFGDDNTQENTNNSTLNELLVAGPLFNFNNVNVMYGNRLTQSEIENISKTTIFSNGLSANFGQYSVTNNLTWQNTESLNTTSQLYSSNEAASGTISMRRRFGRLGNTFFNKLPY